MGPPAQVVALVHVGATHMVLVHMAPAHVASVDMATLTCGEHITSEFCAWGTHLSFSGFSHGDHVFGPGLPGLGTEYLPLASRCGG